MGGTISPSATVPQDRMRSSIACAARALGDSGPIESWASGVLYDNVRIDGAGLNLRIAGLVRRAPAGRPPTACCGNARRRRWPCFARRPPTIGRSACGLGFAGDGTFEGRSDSVRPMSLYQAQLRERRGGDAAAHVGLGLVDPIGSTNPTLGGSGEVRAQSRSARAAIDRRNSRAISSSARGLVEDEDEFDKRTAPRTTRQSTHRRHIASPTNTTRNSH